MTQTPSAKERSPVVVVMGHVDHGKTTLLDYLRKSNTAAREAGGITQSIGAYQLEHGGRHITFIDTPGHEAFTSMRSRGAEVADLAILVVAADEGVKPQTKEAAHILKQTKTPFVVAITKTDTPGADIENVKNELTSAEVFLEGYGGNISYQPISAKTGEHVGDLLDLVLLAADLEGLTYDPEAPCHGYVLETRTNTQRGNEATVIVRDGTLRRGDDIATATATGRVKMLEDFAGKTAKEIPAGAPALIVGFETLPGTGETFFAGESAYDHDKEPLAVQTPKDILATENMPSEGTTLILKAADAGSLEALKQVIGGIQTEVPFREISSSVGDVTEGDVKLAIPTHAAIVGFKTKVDQAAKNLARDQGVTILTSNIVYDLLKGVEDLSEQKKAGAVLGELEILALFNQKNQEKQLVGGKVLRGSIRKKGRFSLIRADEEAGQGQIVSVHEGKNDVDGVEAGKECGVIVSASSMIEVGDHLVVREKKERK